MTEGDGVMVRKVTLLRVKNESVLWRAMMKRNDTERSLQQFVQLFCSEYKYKIEAII